MRRLAECPSIAVHSHLLLGSSGKRLTDSLQKHGGTVVLLIHQGQPRTSVYAADYLSKFYQRIYGIPPFFSRKVLSSLFKNRIATCLRNSQDFPYLDDTLRIFAGNIERLLAKVMPECGPVTCRFAADGWESVAANLQFIMREESEVDRLIVVAMHPLEDRCNTGLLLNAAAAKFSMAADERRPQTVNGWENFMATNQKCVAFSYLISDEIGAQEAFIKCWAQELLRFHTPDVDGIIFALPSTFRWRKMSREKLNAITERIICEMHVTSRTVVTRYRIAYYPSWTELFALPHWTIADRLANLRAAGHRGTILVVPLASHFDDFDTQTVLPAILHDLEDVRLVTPSEVRHAMLNTLVDFLKARITLKMSQT